MALGEVADLVLKLIPRVVTTACSASAVAGAASRKACSAEAPLWHICGESHLPNVSCIPFSVPVST